MSKSRFLPRSEYEQAAARLQCEPETLIAIATVEGAERGAFDDDGFPTLLFERHVMHRLTDGRFDKVAPDLSNPIPSYVDHSYGKYSEQKWRMDRAAKLDRSAALQSASWGLFQVMGENWRLTGATSLQDFVNRMCSGTEAHLAALEAFIASDPKLLKTTRENDFDTFSDLYNGRDGRKNGYPQRMGQAYRMAKARTA